MLGDVMPQELVHVVNDRIVVSSRKVAEVFQKEHNKVLRAVENLKSQNWLFTNMFFESTYKVAGNNKTYPEYLMNRDGFSLLVMGSTGKTALDWDWKLKYIEAFNEMEKFLKGRQGTMTDDEIVTKALSIQSERLRLEQAKNQLLTAQVESQAKEIAEMKPKATYHDLVLACPEVVPISVIAQDYGLSARRMNALLHKLGVQYKKGNLWYLYNAYAGKGYTQSKTYATEEADGEKHAHVHMYWTQKGRFFLYELLREHGIFPIIEQEALSA